MHISATVAAMALAPGALGHAYMSWPVSRNVITATGGPQGANGEGACGSGGMWGEGSAAEQLNSHLTTSLTQLNVGDTIDVTIVYTAAHQGHFVIELCANPGGTITQDCFVRLQRDPSDTRFGPYLANYPEYFFLPQNECISEGNPIKARYKLPAGVSTEHGILRWFWQTGNSCASHSETSLYSASQAIKDWSGTINGRSCGVAFYPGGPCGNDCPRPECTSEQFRNCADIKIGSGGSSSGGGNNNGSGNNNGGGNNNNNGGNNGGGSSGTCTTCDCIHDKGQSAGWCQTTCYDGSWDAFCSGKNKPNCIREQYPDLCEVSGGGNNNNNNNGGGNNGGGNTGGGSNGGGSGAGSASSCADVKPKFPDAKDYCTGEHCQVRCGTAADKQSCMHAAAPDHCA